MWLCGMAGGCSTAASACTVLAHQKLLVVQQHCGIRRPWPQCWRGGRGGGLSDQHSGGGRARAVGVIAAGDPMSVFLTA